MTSPSITIRIDPPVLDRFPGLSIGGFIVERLDHAALGATTLDGLWREAGEALRSRAVLPDTLPSNPAIAQWRGAATASGLKPSTYRSSVEALVRRVLKDGAVRTPLPMVDAYCAVSVSHLAPLGAYDIDRLPSVDIALRHAKPGDRFAPLGGRAEDMPLSERVAVYGAGDAVLCWHFNHRDSRDTCLTPESTRAVFIGESLDPTHRPDLLSALERLAQVLTEAGAVTGEIGFVDAARPIHLASSRA